MENLTVEIICVGTELLLGNIVNTNAAYLSEKCAALGLSCYYQSVVGDNAERLAESLKIAMERSDIVILSGGLGPTEDDLTKETAAKVCGRELVLHEASHEAIAEYFERRGMTTTENNWKQALLPKDSIVLDNPNGTAPGVIIEDAKAKVILLPGPPNEMEPMFADHVRPYLAKLTERVIVSKTVKICGVGESKVETQILDLIDAQTNPTLATYAKTGEVHIRVTASAEDEAAAKKLLKPVVRELKSRFGSNVYSTEDDGNLAGAVVDLLAANKKNITFAESCTGGLLSGRLVDVPGASEVYKAGIVTYSNKAKHKLLGVKKRTLRTFGAVSEQTAREMAKGVAELTEADVAVAVTGIAGPDGGTEEKPVGLVYIACKIGDHVEVSEYHFSGNRRKVRESTVAAALVLARRCILEHGSKSWNKK